MRGGRWEVGGWRRLEKKSEKWDSQEKYSKINFLSIFTFKKLNKLSSIQKISVEKVVLAVYKVLNNYK